MLMYKVKSKATGAETLVTPAAYNLAKKRFAFISQVQVDQDGKEVTPKVKSETQAELPKNSPQVQHKEEEKAAAPVVSEQAKAKRGPKPKNKISSQATTVEV